MVLRRALNYPSPLPDGWPPPGGREDFVPCLEAAFPEHRVLLWCWSVDDIKLPANVTYQGRSLDFDDDRLEEEAFLWCYSYFIDGEGIEDSDEDLEAHAVVGLPAPGEEIDLQFIIGVEDRVLPLCQP